MKLVPVMILSMLAVRVLQAQQSGCPPHASHIEVASGSFSSQPGVSFALHHFQASLVPMGDRLPACLQKMTVVTRAEIFVSNETLTKIFAEKVAKTESKIKNFKVENSVDRVTLSGRIVKVIPIQFSVAGPVTTDGKLLLLDAKNIKADGIPVKALLGLVGEHLSSVLGLKGVNGVSVDGNTMSFAPEEIAHLKGYIRSVQTSDKGLTLIYGSAPAHNQGSPGR